MRELTEFLPYVLPFAAACPEPTAEKYIREAAIEFCQRTRVWREIDSFPVTGHELETACAPPHSELFEIERAWLDGVALTPVSMGEVAFMLDEHGGGQPAYITQSTPNSIRVLPRGPGKLRISMFLKPSLDAEVLPSFLFDQYAKVIGEGALAQICLLPNQPFTSPDYAMMFAGRFNAACDRNFAVNLKGQQRGRVRTKPSFF